MRKSERGDTEDNWRPSRRRRAAACSTSSRAAPGASTVLRLVLERTDGEPVTIEDCEAVSRDASPLLDVSDEIAHRYTLEVSSAGLDRKLYSLEDATRFVGRRVRVQTECP